MNYILFFIENYFFFYSTFGILETFCVVVVVVVAFFFFWHFNLNHNKWRSNAFCVSKHFLSFFLRNRVKKNLLHFWFFQVNIVLEFLKWKAKHIFILHSSLLVKVTLNKQNIFCFLLYVCLRYSTLL